MAFFPRNLYHSHHTNNNTDSSFTPLFRLLDDFDNYSRQGGGASSNTRRPGLQTWQPKFDIRETADNYELHGELAGLSKDDVHIEFSDPQTMQIRGKVERTYTAGTPPAGLLGGTSSASAITEGGEEKHDSAHKATVEDESEVAKKTESPAGEPAAAEKPATAADNAKYWLTERSIGEFARTFSFPTRVEQDGVTASLKDGILNVTVPKAKKYESRRIAIN
ncbi:unnamed protein product [Clonostachys rhizophaga]|uniref:SHSP domain-containing protein n=1 Tax=Clonostachys rhizophaga TaxID=160324 RepID=A0A9N9VE94_9HYPO|nr:unnamed protein product [Clonostachys rhizophaga]